MVTWEAWLLTASINKSSPLVLIAILRYSVFSAKKKTERKKKNTRFVKMASETIKIATVFLTKMEFWRYIQTYVKIFLGLKHKFFCLFWNRFSFSLTLISYRISSYYSRILSAFLALVVFAVLRGNVLLNCLHVFFFQFWSFKTRKFLQMLTFEVPITQILLHRER